MAADNRESLEVSYIDLADGDKGETNIAYFLPEAPNQVGEILLNLSRFKSPDIRNIRPCPDKRRPGHVPLLFPGL